MEVPFASETTTSSVPAAVAAVVALISVAETTVTALASFPIVTVAPDTKPVPLMITAVPPADGPEVGVIVLTAGTGGGGGAS